MVSIVEQTHHPKQQRAQAFQAQSAIEDGCKTRHLFAEHQASEFCGDNSCDVAQHTRTLLQPCIRTPVRRSDDDWRAIGQPHDTHIVV
jgi:hypothetical protein